jgi:hypothetical protein
MADCFVVASADGGHLLVQRIRAVEGGSFLARVLVSTLSAHFNKLPEVKYYAGDPIVVREDDVKYPFAVISTREFVCGPFPVGKSKGHLMYHAGMERVATIEDAGDNFPLSKSNGGHVHIPLCNELLLFRVGLVGAIRAAFDNRGCTVRTSKISCSHRVWYYLVSEIGEPLYTKRGTKSGSQHIMNRPSSVKISNDSLAVKCTSMVTLQKLLGIVLCIFTFTLIINCFILSILFLFYFVNNHICIMN